VGQGWKAGARQPPRPVRKSLSQQDQEFAKRQRIAERLVRALREAGYSCDLGARGHWRAGSKAALPSRRASAAGIL